MKIKVSVEVAVRSVMAQLTARLSLTTELPPSATFDACFISSLC